MEGSSGSEPAPPGPGGTSAAPGPLLSSGPLDKWHHQADSVLTAARLARRGWTEEGTKMAWGPDPSRRPAAAGSDGNRASARGAVGPKEPGGGRVRDAETGGDRPADETTRAEASFSADRRAEGQTGLRVVVSVRRAACRQPRRFKAPRLPVIAEM